MTGTVPFHGLPRAAVPLSRDAHAAKRWHTPRDYDFARKVPSVPVVLAEAEATAAAFPLIFQDDPETGLPMPVAVLRLQADTTPFIAPDGRWLAPYIPALLRVAPFSTRPPADAQQGDAAQRMELWVDEASGLVTEDDNDQRFFDPFGGPTPALEKVVAFFRQYEGSRRTTHAAMAAIAGVANADGQGLLRPLKQGDTQYDGMWMIDRASFDALDDQTFLHLRAAGAMPLVLSHFVGCHQLSWLSRAEAALAHPAPQRGAAGQVPRSNTPAPTAREDLSDFLAALALAQNDDMLSEADQDSTTTRGEE